MPELLTDKQRRHTRRIHAVSGTLVAGKLLLVVNSKALYGEAISCFYPIICTIEDLIKSKAAEQGLADFPALVTKYSRREKLAEDLQYFLGESWEAQISRTAAVNEYIDILNQVAKDNPLLLTAYFYGLYVAFAAGGQILKRRIIKNLDLKDGDGTHFFDFDGGAAEAKVALKAAFNKLGEGLTDEQTQQILEASATMFQMNNKVIYEFPVTTPDVVATLKKCALSSWMLPVYAVVAASVAAVYFTAFKR